MKVKTNLRAGAQFDVRASIVPPAGKSAHRSCRASSVRPRACSRACRMARVSTNGPEYEFVSVAEAATSLGISPTTVRERIRAGLLEAERVNRPPGIGVPGQGRRTGTAQARRA